MANVVKHLKIKLPHNVADPNKCWTEMKLKQRVDIVSPLPHDTPRKEGHTRFVCVSDTHSTTSLAMFTAVPDGDVLLHAGDFSQTGKPGEIEKFRDWLLALPHRHKVVIAGNHDLTFEPATYSETYRRFGHHEMFDTTAIRNTIIEAPGVTYLEDTACTINGIKIWGSPWQPEFFDWAFNLPRGEALQSKWDLIPSDTDVLMTHGPPIGHGDLCQHGGRAGCVNLLCTIQQRVKPLYHVFGHIHEGYGITTDGVTTYINASTCNLRYRPVQAPVIFDIPEK